MGTCSSESKGRRHYRMLFQVLQLFQQHQMPRVTCSGLQRATARGAIPVYKPRGLHCAAGCPDTPATVKSNVQISSSLDFNTTFMHFSSSASTASSDWNLLNQLLLHEYCDISVFCESRVEGRSQVMREEWSSVCRDEQDVLRHREWRVPGGPGLTLG